MTYDVAGHTFGWDNENPARRVEVGHVRMEGRPVTNGEYLAFWNGVASGVSAELGFDQRRDRGLVFLS